MFHRTAVYNESCFCVITSFLCSCAGTCQISNIDLSHKHKNFSYSVQFQTRTLVLCTRMENWKYFFVSSFVLLCCLRDAKSEKSDNEIDKTKWTPKLRDPVKVKYFIKSVPASFSSKCRISV